MLKPLYFTYILRCADDTYYVGVTNNITRRLLEHNSPDHPRSFCHHRRPVELVFLKAFRYILQAIAYEKQVKKWSRAKKEALILHDFSRLHELATCKNETSHVFYVEQKKPKE